MGKEKLEVGFNGEICSLMGEGEELGKKNEAKF